MNEPAFRDIPRIAASDATNSNHTSTTMPRPTMLDVTKRLNADKEVGLIEANLEQAPELKYFPARTIQGTCYNTLLRIGLPSVEFTAVNEGIQPSKSTYETKLVECHIIRSMINVDKAIASVDETIFDLENDEALGVTESVMRKLGRQIYYGRKEDVGDSKGFFGLQDVVPNEKLVNAGGDAENDASSVYFIKFGRKDVTLVFGRNEVLKVGEFRDESIRDANGGRLDGRVAHLTGWVGLQATNPNSVVRICNLTEQSGKTLTDDLMAQALSVFPAGQRPDIIFMTRRSQRQLQQDRASRTTLVLAGGKSYGGKEVYVETPTSFESIPIVSTDSLLNTEEIVPGA